jgi:hypothetical protein
MLARIQLHMCPFDQFGGNTINDKILKWDLIFTRRISVGFLSRELEGADIFVVVINMSDST